MWYHMQKNPNEGGGPMENRKASALRRALPAIVLLLAGLAVLIWKAPYGMAIPDEALYLTIPYRLLQGDSLLVHEWHVTQLASLLLAPLLRLVLALRGTTQGVVLTFRRLYILFHSLTTLYLWLRLRRVSHAGALWAALLYLMYAPMNIATLSYNTMGIGLLAIVFVTLALGGERAWEAVLCGLCFAGAVLCNPWYFLLYPVYVLAAVCARKNPDRAPCLRLRFLLLLTAAGAVAALLAFWRALGRAELSLLRETLPAVLHGDTAEHPDRGLVSILYGMFRSFGRSRLFLPTLGLSAALCLAARFDKRRAAHVWAYLLAAALLTLAYALWFRAFDNISINFYMFPVNILGFFAWLIPERRRDRLFFFVYLPGVVCWFCSAAASNLGFINIASVSTLNMLASAVLICEAAKTLRPTGTRGRAAAACMLLALAVQLGLITEARIRTVYPIQPAAACTARIEHGALRGLLVEPEDCARQEAAFAAAAPVREAEGGFVAYLSDVPGEYLDDAKRCGVYSAWFPASSAADNLPRLLRFWELFPERVPALLAVGTDDAEASALLLGELEARGYVEIGSGGGLALLRLEADGGGTP